MAESASARAQSDGAAAGVYAVAHPIGNDTSECEEAKNPNAVVRVNVGGVEHVTTAGTLGLAGESSPLRKLRPSAAGKPSPFLDRDGELFTHVLRFLRYGVLPESRAFRDGLGAEARALHIPELRDAVRERGKKDSRFGVLVFERVTVLVDGKAVEGHFCLAGRVESAARWFSGFSIQALVSQFQERVETEVEGYCARTGLVLADCSTTAAITSPVGQHTGPTAGKMLPQRVVHVHTMTCTFRAPGCGK